MTNARKPLPKSMEDALDALTPEQRRLLTCANVRRRSAHEFLGLPWYAVIDLFASFGLELPSPGVRPPARAR